MDMDDEFDPANRRASERLGSFPGALSARYDRRLRRVILQLGPKLEVSFSPEDAEGLQNASARDLSVIEISPSGLGIHFPKLDADLYLPAVMEGLLGSRRWMASRMGSTGGRARSVSKSSAARRNGQLGGRPKKKQIPA